MPLTIGADPELFVADSANNIVSGIGHVGGTKTEPKPVNCGAVQEDNVLAEFNIDPCSTAQQFCEKVTAVTDELNKILDSSGLHTVVMSSHEFDEAYLVEQGDKALEFGCDPDTNCWTREENNPPDPYTGLRTAGGHVHVGYDNPNRDRSFEIACILDYLLGASSVLLDSDHRRRGMYGQGGACRIKPYGVEYRVLSNFWLNSESLKKWIFDTTCLVEHLKLDDVTCFMEPEELLEVINTSDHDRAMVVVGQMLEHIEGFYIPELES